jgi:putative DNA primase/helicase
LDPILQTQGSALVYAHRGVGKTHFSIGAAIAVAAGGTFLGYGAPRPRRVLFVDGEMPGVALQERFAAAARRLSGNAGADPDFLRIVTPDMQHPDWPLPDLRTPEGQAQIEELLDGVEFLILDNISTLFRSGAGENDEESWRGGQGWILRLRRAGISTLLVHHAAKNGAQRGTSKREDILDTVIALKRPADYNPKEGARFEVHLEKARSISGDAAAPYEAWLQGDVWTVKTIEDLEVARVIEGKAEGMSVRDIASELSISKSRVQRILKSHEGNANGRSN